jgi:hypothetical protein
MIRFLSINHPTEIISTKIYPVIFAHRGAAGWPWQEILDAGGRKEGPANRLKLGTGNWKLVLCALSSRESFKPR